MMKFIAVIFFIISVISLKACNLDAKLDINQLEKSTYEDYKQSKDVELSIKENNITQSTEFITLIFTNISDKEYFYGEDHYLEIKDNKTWYEVPIKEGVGWNDIGYMLGANNSNELIFNIKDYYGKLNKGNYRIIKKLYENGEEILCIAEFEINN